MRSSRLWLAVLMVIAGMTTGAIAQEGEIELQDGPGVFALGTIAEIELGKIWKLLVVGLAAAGAWLKRLFGRSEPVDSPEAGSSG